MMYSWDLPTSLEVQGKQYKINSDFRAVLDIIAAFNDPELPEWAKNEVMIEILYTSPMPAENLEDAVHKALWFIDAGKQRDEKPRPITMNWVQDAPIIFPSINKIAGYETRNSEKYTHWWTFMGYFDEIYDGLFSQVLSIRQKRAKGKKLDKWEKEFAKENKNLIELTAILSKDEVKRRKAEQEAVDALFE